MGGPAIVNLLTGEANPSGKTPVTFLRTVGQAPLYYNHNMTGRPYSGELLMKDIALEAGQTSLGNTSYYLDYGAYPLFPFGFGLSYTSFEYSGISLDRQEYRAEDTIGVTFTLANTGSREGTEVAQVYVRDLVGSIARPVKELKYFERVALAAGESRTVTFTLTPSDISRFDPEAHKWVADKGTYKALFGTSSADILAEATFEMK
jgi:beta-glucosidase